MRHKKGRLLFTIVAPGQTRLRAGLQAEPKGILYIHGKVYPKPDSKKKAKKLTKKEAGISHKMELADIRLRFGAPVTQTRGEQKPRLKFSI
jgi:hypothetical protein